MKGMVISILLIFIEGQRKANFEEYDAKKEENYTRIMYLKREIKKLQEGLVENKKVLNISNNNFSQSYQSSTLRKNFRNIN